VVYRQPALACTKAQTNAALFSVSGNLENGVTTIYTPSAVATGTYIITVRCENDSDSSAEVTRTITIATSPFESITPKLTVVKAVHIQTMRDTINHVRGYYALAPVTWMDQMIPKRSYVRDWPMHIIEVRKAVEAIILAINGYGAGVPLPTWEEMGNLRAAAMAQMHTVIQTL
jgi:hypothetical protein